MIFPNLKGGMGQFPVGCSGFCGCLFERKGTNFLSFEWNAKLEEEGLRGVLLYTCFLFILASALERPSSQSKKSWQFNNLKKSEE
jgi:hypothetical protein